MARFWEALGPPKIEKKQKKSMFCRVPFGRGVLEGFWEGFWDDLGRVLGGFWKHFGKVLDGFGEDFVLESRIAFGETCVKRFKVKTLL